jgi:hypothetical protein
MHRQLSRFSCLCQQPVGKKFAFKGVRTQKSWSLSKGSLFMVADNRREGARLKRTARVAGAKKNQRGIY